MQPRSNATDHPSTPRQLKIRKGSAVADIIIVEGYHGAQPTDG